MQLMAANLDRTRFEPAVFSFAGGERGPQLRAAGVATHVGGDLLGAAARLRPDVIHVHRAGWPEPALLRAIKLAGAKVVVETNVFGRYDPSPGSAVVDCILFISHFCLARYAAATGVAAAAPRYRVLYYPVDTDFFESAVAPQDFASPVAGRLSRADPGKWSRLAFDIAPLLAAKVPGFRYRVIGAIPEFVDFIRGRGLESQVECLAPVATDAGLASFFSGISLLAHANETGESFGLAIAEAMSAGLPVITHPAEGLRDNAQLELVEHGVTGLVAASAEEYADAAAWLFAHPDRAREMGRAGRAKAKKLYRAQAIAGQLETMYLELLAGARA
ncbi:MAG: glycosyltransferase family 4 protein [Desulfovibrionaceae bacterium]|nr:glycosyltransferase family 4 protein [Desulfovibrionaceae bacterium]MBF0514635.1 glycosyltransferase family 4 protein [Desulfovibrionaceae bacterium]